MISFVATVLNEEKTIDQLLLSIDKQQLKPDEIIFVDGGSFDSTVEKIKLFGELCPHLNIKCYVISGGNRAMGRNKGIRFSRGEIIVISDAGCILDQNWLKNIVEPFRDPKIDVVAGYYKAKTISIFEKCIAPYVLVPRDRINIHNFLPASRSMALRKAVWKKLGGFPEKFSDNEDFVLANEMKKKQINIFFTDKAIVSWYPCKNIKSFVVMIFRFARGDTKANLRYGKMLTVYTRYIVFVLLFLSFPIMYLLITLFLYLSWAVWKNYRYVNHPLAIIYLPLLQFSSDIAIMAGFIIGIFRLESITLERKK